jgi:cytochrome P450
MQQPACPVHADFDPLSPSFLENPVAALSALPRETPIFYAPSIDYYVVTRYADIKSIFLDPETYSAAAAQFPLVQLVPEAAQILLGGGHKPQPSMVSLDPPAHTRLRSPTARAFTPARVAQMEPRIRAQLTNYWMQSTRPLPSISFRSSRFRCRRPSSLASWVSLIATGHNSKNGAVTVRRSLGGDQHPKNKSTTQRTWQSTGAT